MFQYENTITSVEFTQEALEQLKKLVPHLKYYHSLEEIKAAMEQVLSLDPRSIHRKKLEKLGKEKIYPFYIDVLEVFCEIAQGHAKVINVVLAKKNK